MIVFPNCKINIGLSITGKRSDGYHNIESVMYPVGWNEALEITERDTESEFHSQPFNRSTIIGNVHLYEYGNPIPGMPADNLCIKVFTLVAEWYKMPKTSVHLLKTLPMGAGLGAGSSDAAHCLRLLKDYYNLKISDTEAKALLTKVGSDCPFFWDNEVKFVFGTGTQERPVSLSLTGKYILIVYPGLNISTLEAYTGVQPKEPTIDLSMLGDLPIETWKDCVFNDFEKSVFPKYPALNELKVDLYEMGAIYASMSGSGSALYGIFNSPPEITPKINKSIHWIGKA